MAGRLTNIGRTTITIFGDSFTAPGNSIQFFDALGGFYSDGTSDPFFSDLPITLAPGGFYETTDLMELKVPANLPMTNVSYSVLDYSGISSGAISFTVGGAAPPPPLISGNLYFPGFTPGQQPRNPLLFNFTSLSNPNGSYSRSVLPGTDGSFRITDIPADDYKLLILSNHWLHRKIALSTQTGPYLISETLTAGDSNGDNKVDLNDFGALVNAFGSYAGRADYNFGADFNEDSTVDLKDFGLLVNAFGSAGDN